MLMTPEDLLEEDDEEGFSSLIASLATPATESSAPDWMSGLTPSTTPEQLTRGGTAPLEAADRAVQGATDRIEARGFDRQLANLQQQHDAAAPTGRERFRRIALGTFLGAMGQGDRVREALGPSSTERRAAIQEQMSKLLEQRQKQQRDRRAMLLEQLDSRRRQANDDRRFDLQRRATESLIDRRGELGTATTQRIEQGDRRLDLDERRVGIAEGRAGIRPAAPAEPGAPTEAPAAGPARRSPDAPAANDPRFPRMRLHYPGDVDTTQPPEVQARHREIQRQYLRQREQMDPEFFADILRDHGVSGIDEMTDAQAARVARAVNLQSRNWGQVTGRRARDRRAERNLMRQGRAQEVREEATGDRLQAAQARAGAQRAQRAVPYDEQAEFAEEAAQSLERIVDRTGDMGARIIRGDNMAADLAAAAAGTEVETDRATYRDFLSNLLHERGGASLTPQEKAVIQQALASGSLATSSAATIQTLRNIAARARRRAQQERGTGTAPQQQSAAPRGASGGAERVISERTVEGRRMQMVQRADGTRYTREAGGSQ